MLWHGMPEKTAQAITSTMITCKTEGMLAVSSLKTVDDESNFGGSAALSNKNQQPASSIWGYMDSDK